MDDYREKIAGTYNKQYALMRYFGLWELSSGTPQYLKAIYKIYFWYFLIFGTLLFDLLMIIQVITNITSIEEVIKVLFMLATAIAVLGKILTVKLKNQSYENYFKLIVNKKYLPQNDEEKEIFLNCIDLNIKVRNFYKNISYSACGGFFITNYLSNNQDLPVSVYMPISLDTNWKYNLAYVYVCLSLLVLCLTNVAFDTLSTSFFIHLKGQLEMLGHRLENIGKNTNPLQDAILQQLKDCVRFYNQILKLAHDIEYMISIPISLQIGCSIIVLIASLFTMSLLSSSSGELANLVKVVLYQACMLSQIFMLCYFPNEVSLKSCDLSYNLFKADWWNWNKFNRKLVLLMVLRFATPIRITSINRCYSFNLATFTSKDVRIHTFLSFCLGVIALANGRTALWYQLFGQHCLSTNTPSTLTVFARQIPVRTARWTMAEQTYIYSRRHILNCSYSYFALLKRMNS